ncbi:MAG: AAA family ATPase [Proteobacteria bacterium]|nr:AAA family ATPase [Pseudomonadota bacterium]
MQVRFLHITGPQVAPATVEFGSGLNVIHGGSNTGKSHILRLINYVLGAKLPPEPIAEQVGYDLVHLGVILDDNSEVTFVRALQGGEIKLLEGLTRERPNKSQGTALAAQHGKKASLSKFLLEKVGAGTARIRTDAKGTTRELSFRDLLRHALINEVKIQDAISPVLSGQYTSKTAEVSVFKYALTGVDDSALDLAKPDPTQPTRQAAQLELLDRQIRDLDQEISEANQDDEELRQLDETLDRELATSFEVQEVTEVSYRDLTGRRHELKAEYEAIVDRVFEIDTLTARFDLLADHYESDKKRLASIAESGIYFTLEDGATCPVCGANPEYHLPHKACDGNVAEIVAAATAEIEALDSRAKELAATIEGLKLERHRLINRREASLSEIEQLRAAIMLEVPAVQNVRSKTNAVIQRKLAIQKHLALVQRKEGLLRQREGLGVNPGYDSSTIVAQQHLDGAVLDDFCQVVQAELEAWEFPGVKRVFFEIAKMDISIAGKPRSANGKGVKALLHGAFSIALMQYCSRRKRAHVGFTVLDSLFVTYKDPDNPQDSEIASTPLKDRAFQTFLQMSQTMQLIVLENVDVPAWLQDHAQCIHFTGESSRGRAGLFPVNGA